MAVAAGGGRETGEARGRTVATAIRGAETGSAACGADDLAGVGITGRAAIALLSALVLTGVTMVSNTPNKLRLKTYGTRNLIFVA